MKNKNLLYCIISLLLTIPAISYAQNWVPVYRKYLNNNPYHEHLYTKNINEVTSPWQDEGIAFYVSSTSFSGSSPVYRLRKDGSPRLRLLTTNELEKNNAITTGYVLEQVLGYIYSSSNPEASIIYRVFKGSVGDRLYTSNWSEMQELINNEGYKEENNLGHAPIYGAISGGVRDASNNNPIGNASVRLKQSGITKYEALSNSISGVYSIGNVIPGNYTLEGSKTGYQSASYSVIINPIEESKGKNLALTSQNTPPSVNITSGPTGTIQETTVRFEWQGFDSDGTIAGYYYGMDVADPNIWTTETYNVFTNMPEGFHTFKIKSKDNNGSLSGIVERSFTIKIGSNLTLVYPTPNSTITIDEITFKWSNVNATKYELYVDNNSGSMGSAEISPQHIDELKKLTATEFTICANWLCQGNYFWKVKAFLSNGSTIESSVSTFQYLPPTVTSPQWEPLYRLYKSADKDHFYCSNDAHRQTAIDKGFVDERVEGFISIKRFHDSRYPNDTVNIFRFYDSSKKCHYYTTDENDKDNKIIANLTYEGITGFAYKNPHDNLIILHHLYNPSNYDHFYTISQFEKDNAIKQYGFQLQNNFPVYISPNGDNSMIPVRESQLIAGNGINTQNGNFTHYTKTSFNMADIGIPIIFEHVYNSVNVHLAADITPLGPGWTHSYNIYFIDYGSFFAVFWPDGSIHTYDHSTYDCTTPGVYDFLNKLSGNQYRITNKNQIKYYFEQLAGASSDSPYMLKYIEDRNGNKVVCEYESNRLKTITGTTGRKINIIYLFKSNMNKYFIDRVTEDALSRSIYYTYDDLGNLITYKDAESYITNYYYSTDNPKDHQLIKIKLPRGNVIDNTYENRKMKSQQWNGRTNLLLTFVNNKTNVKDTKMGYEIECEHNVNGILSEILDKSGPTGTIQYWYEDSRHISKPTKIKDNRNFYTNYVYDVRGNIEQIQQPGGIVQKFKYDYMNNLTQYTDPNGHTTIYTYNSKGNLEKIIDPLSHTIQLSRRSDGLISSSTNPMSHATSYTYDNYGNIQTVSPPLVPPSHYTHDAASRLKKIINAENQTTNYEYNNNDQIKKIIDNDQGPINYNYDENGNLKSIADQKSQKTDWNYNFDDLLESIQNPKGNRTSFAYNADGSIASKSLPEGPTINYGYDQTGRLNKISTSGYSAQFTLDANGNIKQVTDNEGKSLNFNYDELNRLDDYTDFYGNKVDYEYDNASNIRAIIYPGGKKVRYEYYSDNRLSTVIDWNGKSTSYIYRNDGTLRRINLPNNCYTIYDYDSADRLTGISNHKSSDQLICSYNYVLDNIGNIKNETRTEPLNISSLIAKNIILNYDPANRLQNAGSTAYNFNNNGNMTSRTGANPLTLTYDYDNRLQTVSGSANASYVYDVFGNRRQATRNNTTVRYVLDIIGSMSQVLMETNASNTPTAYYIYGIGLIYRIKADGTYQYYHYNNVGSTIAMIDQNQNITHKYCYAPFGELLKKEEADFNPFRFVGQYGVMDEENGLYFMRARYYDPEVGRFISEDPIWDANLFQYTQNNPLIDSDPKGTISTNERKKQILLQRMLALQEESAFYEQIENQLQQLQIQMQLAADICNYTGDLIVPGATGLVSSIGGIAFSAYFKDKKGTNSYIASGFYSAFSFSYAKLWKYGTKGIKLPKSAEFIGSNFLLPGDLIKTILGQ